MPFVRARLHRSHACMSAAGVARRGTPSAVRHMPTLPRLAAAIVADTGRGREEEGSMAGRGEGEWTLTLGTAAPMDGCARCGGPHGGGAASCIRPTHTSHPPAPATGLSCAASVYSVLVKEYVRLGRAQREVGWGLERADVIRLGGVARCGWVSGVEGGRASPPSARVVGGGARGGMSGEGFSPSSSMTRTSLSGRRMTGAVLSSVGAPLPGWWLDPRGRVGPPRRRVVSPFRLPTLRWPPWTRGGFLGW